MELQGARPIFGKKILLKFRILPFKQRVIAAAQNRIYLAQANHMNLIFLITHLTIENDAIKPRRLVSVCFILSLLLYSSQTQVIGQDVPEKLRALQECIEAKSDYLSIAEIKIELLKLIDNQELEKLICTSHSQAVRISLQWDLIRRRIESAKTDNARINCLHYFLGYLQAHLDFPLPDNFNHTVINLKSEDGGWLEYADYEPSNEKTICEHEKFQIVVKKNEDLSSAEITCESEGAAVWAANFVPPYMSDWGDSPSLNRIELQVSSKKETLYVFGTTELAFFIYTFDLRTGKRYSSAFFTLTPPTKAAPKK